jgi:hypothetical protein
MQEKALRWRSKGQRRNAEEEEEDVEEEDEEEKSCLETECAVSVDDKNEDK